MTIPSPLDPVLGGFARPTFGQPGFAPVRRQEQLGAKFDTMMNLPCWVGDSIRLVSHGAMGAVGIFVGVTQNNAWGVVGWIVGLMSSFAAVLDIASLVCHLFC